MFANLVVELKKHHYSQRGLAAYIGISESSMNDKMNGRTQFTMREAKAIQAIQAGFQTPYARSGGWGHTLRGLRNPVPPQGADGFTGKDKDAVEFSAFCAG